MHESPWRCTPCRYQVHVCIYASTTSTAFTLAPYWHQIRMQCTNSLYRLAHLLLLSTTANQPSLHPPPFFLSSHSHTTTHFHLWLLLVLFPLALHSLHFTFIAWPNNRARGCVAFQAWRGAEALFSCLSDEHKKWAQQGTASQQMAFPGRELAKRPRQGLQNIPRQGTGKCSQAGNWQAFPGRELASVPGRDCKTYPGRALANVPRQGTGKRPRQGLQNIPRQGTGKCSQAENLRRPKAGDSGCSQAGNWKHCKRALRK